MLAMSQGKPLDTLNLINPGYAKLLLESLIEIKKNQHQPDDSCPAMAVERRALLADTATSNSKMVLQLTDRLSILRWAYSVSLCLKKITSQLEYYFKIWESFVNIFDRVAEKLLNRNYTLRELRLLAVSCYLVSSKFEGITNSSFRFSAEVACDIVKLGVKIADVKATECSILRCLNWSIPDIYPSESCLFLFQAQKFFKSSGSTLANLNLNSWVKEIMHQTIKLALEQQSYPLSFCTKGFWLL
jgi:Cyclin, N-terminal domain